MPTFDFTSPDGKTYTVEGPEGATPEQAFQILQQQIGTSPASGGGTATGVAKSLGVGLAEGAIGLAGLPGDLYHMGLRALGDNLTPQSNYGSNAIQKSVEGVTGEFYKPQGTAESLANKVGQFAPAMIGGPETLAMRFATRAAAPAVASEAAGALTEGTAVQPYAELAGALAGGAGATAAANKFRSMAAARNTPQVSLEDIKKASRSAYQHQDVKDVRFAAAPANKLADDISVDLRASGFRPNVAETGKPVFDLVDEIRGAATVADLDSVRRALNNVAKQRDTVGQLTPSAAAAGRAINQIDGFLPNLKQADLLAGDAQKASSILEEARKNWGAYRRAKTAQTTLDNALLNAASANSGGNIQNSIKQAFKPMLKNDAAKAVGYSKDELEQLNKVVRGTWTGGAARAAGNLLGGGGGLGMLASGAVGYSQGGVGGAIAAGLAGRGLKKIGDRSTFNAVKKLDAMLRVRSPEALKFAASLPPQALQQLPAKTQSLLSVAVAAQSAVPRQSITQNQG